MKRRQHFRKQGIAPTKHRVGSQHGIAFPTKRLDGSQYAIYENKMPACGYYRTVAMQHDGGNYLARNPLMYIKFMHSRSGWLAGEVSPRDTVVRGPFTTNSKPLQLGAETEVNKEGVVGCDCIESISKDCEYDGFQSATFSCLTPGQTFPAIPINPDADSEDSESDSEVPAHLPAHDIDVLEGDILCTFTIKPFSKDQEEHDVYTHLARKMSAKQVRAASSLLGTLRNKDKDDECAVSLVYEIGRQLESC